MYCSECGTENDANNYQCVSCGEFLHDEDTGAADDGLAALIPYRNSCALIAYYLGVFSIIPILGIPVGIGGFVLGLLGLRAAAAHPKVKGKIHAWVGIIVGGLFGFGYLALAILMIVRIAADR